MATAAAAAAAAAATAAAALRHAARTQELEDCCQLVKANSIQGNKDPSATVVYTPWANLRKTSECVTNHRSSAAAAALTRVRLSRRVFRGSMEVGQVGFVSDAAVKRFHVAKRCNETVNRLNKTRREAFPDLAAEREAYDVAGRAERKAEERARRKTELELQREREREQQERSYDRIMAVRPSATLERCAPASTRHAASGAC